ncbi:Alpha-latrotoxin-.t1.c1a [Apiospora arundinis]|uniref:Alpha-latrotoxin-.t1.c1a n=1 Tax=Apiospora arundinis TaxID=335852 RepID=A0ABR2JMR5_9PEZI
MSKIFELPVELFLEIFGYIDKGEDWTTLTCVNREFYNFATGRIWGPIENSEQKQHQVFMWACASGSTRAIRRLLQGGLPIKFTYQSGGMRELYYMTPQIYLDIPQDDFGRGQAFVTNMDAFHPPATIMIHSKSSFWMPLHVAASGGQSEAAETLLEHGADIESPSLNYCNSEFWDLTPVGKFTPLHTAIQEGQIDVANLLISKGASIYVDRVASRPEKTSGPGRGRLTAFHCCAVYDRKSIAETLVNQGYGAAIDEIDEFGRQRTHYDNNEETGGQIKCIPARVYLASAPGVL